MRKGGGCLHGLVACIITLQQLQEGLRASRNRLLLLLPLLLLPGVGRCRCRTIANWWVWRASSHLRDGLTQVGSQLRGAGFLLLLLLLWRKLLLRLIALSLSGRLISPP